MSSNALPINNSFTTSNYMQDISGAPKVESMANISFLQFPQRHFLRRLRKTHLHSPSLQPLSHSEEPEVNIASLERINQPGQWASCDGQNMHQLYLNRPGKLGEKDKCAGGGCCLLSANDEDPLVTTADAAHKMCNARVVKSKDDCMKYYVRFKLGGKSTFYRCHAPMFPTGRSGITPTFKCLLAPASKNAVSMNSNFEDATKCRWEDQTSLWNEYAHHDEPGVPSPDPLKAKSLKILTVNVNQDSWGVLAHLYPEGPSGSFCQNEPDVLLLQEAQDGCSALDTYLRTKYHCMSWNEALGISESDAFQFVTGYERVVVLLWVNSQWEWKVTDDHVDVTTLFMGFPVLAACASRSDVEDCMGSSGVFQRDAELMPKGKFPSHQCAEAYWNALKAFHGKQLLATMATTTDDFFAKSEWSTREGLVVRLRSGRTEVSIANIHLPGGRNDEKYLANAPAKDNDAMVVAKQALVKMAIDDAKADIVAGDFNSDYVAVASYPDAGYQPELCSGYANQAGYLANSYKGQDCPTAEVMAAKMKMWNFAPFEVSLGDEPEFDVAMTDEMLSELKAAGTSKFGPSPDAALLKKGKVTLAAIDRVPLYFGVKQRPAYLHSLTDHDGMFYKLVVASPTKEELEQQKP